MQLLSRFINPLPILTIDDEDETLSACVIVPPQRSNLILSADVPHVELYVLVGHGLNVETDWLEVSMPVKRTEYGPQTGRDGRYGLV